jgi:hypothetical protein
VCLLLFSSVSSAEDVVDYAAKYIGRPYVWGAEGPTSFDCSGLMQYVFDKFGIDLPRRAIDQSRVGDRAGRRLRRGDMIFFSTDTRRKVVTHVGLYEDDGFMIEANKSAGRVRRTNLDDEFWQDRFMFARRVDMSDARINRPSRRDERASGRPAPAMGKREAAVLAAQTIASVLLKRPGR